MVRERDGDRAKGGRDDWTPGWSAGVGCRASTAGAPGVAGRSGARGGTPRRCGERRRRPGGGRAAARGARRRVDQIRVRGRIGRLRGPGMTQVAPAPLGNTRAVTHGARSPRLVQPLAEQLEAEMLESPPPWWTDYDRETVRALAYAQARIEKYREFF